MDIEAVIHVCVVLMRFVGHIKEPHLWVDIYMKEDATTKFSPPISL